MFKNKKREEVGVLVLTYPKPKAYKVTAVFNELADVTFTCCSYCIYENTIRFDLDRVGSTKIISLHEVTMIDIVEEETK